MDNFKVIGSWLSDVEEKLELDVPSRTTKIKITNEFLAELDKQHINYKLN